MARSALMSRKEDVPPVPDDLRSLGMSLGKTLGRLELSGVEVVEQLVVLMDRCEVIILTYSLH